MTPSLPWLPLTLALALSPPAGTSTGPAGPEDDGPGARPAPVWATVPPTGGRLETVEGTPVLHLTGPTVEERGFAEGYLLADPILACFREFALGHVVADRPLLWDLLIRPGVAARFTFTEEERRWAAAVVLGMDVAREGDLALGKPDRDLDADDILACAAIPDLAGFLCSSLAVWGDASTEGALRVGRNLDYPSTPAIERHSMVEVHHPLGERAGWVGVGWPGSLGCLTGLSDRGLYVAIHDVMSGEPKARGKATPRSIGLEHLLTDLTPGPDTAAEAAALLREHRFVMGGNAMVAWRSADGAARGAAVLELGTDPDVEGGITLRMPPDGASWIACSNDFRERGGRRPRCRRYRTLAEGARGTALDAAALWKLVDDAGMSITLYRTLADLEAGTLVVQRKTAEGWQEPVTVRPAGTR